MWRLRERVWWRGRKGHRGQAERVVGGQRGHGAGEAEHVLALLVGDHELGVGGDGGLGGQVVGRQRGRLVGGREW